MTTEEGRYVLIDGRGWEKPYYYHINSIDPNGRFESPRIAFYYYKKELDKYINYYTNNFDTEKNWNEKLAFFERFTDEIMQYDFETKNTEGEWSPYQRNVLNTKLNKLIQIIKDGEELDWQDNLKQDQYNSKIESVRIDFDPQ